VWPPFKTKEEVIIKEIHFIEIVTNVRLEPCMAAKDMVCGAGGLFFFQGEIVTKNA
jgi:hypothetical protein